METATPTTATGERLAGQAESQRTAPLQEGTPISMILALQQTAGNRAVSRLVQRDIPQGPVKKVNEPATALDASFFSVVGSEPTVTGTTHLDTGRTAESVKIVAPKFDWAADVSVAKDIPGGVGIMVGFQQVMMGSTRSAQYKATGGQEVGYTIVTPQSRDAAPEIAGAGTKGFAEGEAYVPSGGFFSDGSAGGMARVSVAPTAGSNGQPHMFDIPKWDAAKVRDKAPLIGTSGDDKFRVSLVAKEQGKAPVFLANREWGVNWGMTIDTAAAGGPEGKGGQGITVTKTSEGVPQLEGETPHLLGKAWYQFTSLAAASSASTAVLIQNLMLASAGGDSQSHAFTVQALRSRNPVFTLNVSCSETAAFIGSDTVTVTVAGAAAKPTVMTLRAGGSAVASASLLELFPDPTAITSASALTITLAVTSDRGAPSKDVKVAYPFAGLPATTLEVGNIDAGTFALSGTGFP